MSHSSLRSNVREVQSIDTERNQAYYVITNASRSFSIISYDSRLVIVMSKALKKQERAGGSLSKTKRFSLYGLFVSHVICGIELHSLSPFASSPPNMSIIG